MLKLLPRQRLGRKIKLLSFGRKSERGWGKACVCFMWWGRGGGGVEC